MNRKLLVELEDRLWHIERVANGAEAGDPEALFAELLGFAESAAGPESAEYALALRARASHRRNRGEREAAVADYSRAVELLGRAGDATLFQRVQALTSLVALHTQLGQARQADDAERRALPLLARYAEDPDRYAPPSTGDDAPGPPGDLLESLATGLAQARGSPEAARRTLDAAAEAVAARPAMRFAVLLGRAALDEADDEGGPAAAETLARAWSLAASAMPADGFPHPGQWLRLGKLALGHGQPRQAQEAVRRLREMARPGDDRLYLQAEQAALQLETEISLAGGDAARGEDALRRLLAFRRTAFGRDAGATLQAEVDLGRFLTGRGRAAEAVDLLRHAAAARAREEPGDDEAHADALFELGVALDRSGRDTEAMDYYRVAYLTFARALGALHPKAVHAALDLAETARVARDHETAERWFRIVLDATRAAGGERSATAAHALNNLAETLLAAGRADEAAPLAEEGFAIRRERFGTRSHEFDRSLGVVALVAARRGDRERLEAAVDEARAASGSDSVALPVDAIVAYLEAHGDYARAAGLCEQALERLEASGGEADASLLPNQRISLRFTLAGLHARLEQWDEAKRRLMEAFDLETFFLSDEARHRSPRQMRALLGESRGRIAMLLDVLVRAPDTTPDDARAAYEVLQQRRGLETRLLALQRGSFITDRALTAAAPELLEKVRREVAEVVAALRREREAWLAELLALARHPESESDHRALLGWQDQVEMLERRLASYVGVDSYAMEVFSVTSRAPSLPADEAVVEYFFAETPAPTYYAFVVTHDGVQLETLGDAATVHHGLGRLRTHIIDEAPRAGDSDPAWRRRARFLFNRLLRPLLPRLQAARKLYVVPDAELYTLPFDLLPLDDGTLAIDRWTITHLWHGGERAGFNFYLGSPDAPGRAVVVSAPALGGGGDAAWRFAELPHAEREGRAVAERIGAELLAGPAAAKEAVVAAAGAGHADPRDGSAEILHFATHSFWIEQGAGARAEGGSTLFRARAILADPMQRSGIALAGADRDLNAPTAASPGILFASEVLDVDLRDTDLVVLSSCQSGIGDPRPGDGIQGLRRAFRAAGVSSVVSSLWKVPDDATHDLMLDFYDRILAEAPRGEALREAKLAIRDRFAGDPLSWAGFVLDGLDGPLFRFNPMRGFTLATLSGVGISLDRAMDAIANRRWDDALGSLEFVLESNTADHELRAEAAYRRAGVFIATGRLEEAVAALDAMIDNVDTPAPMMREAVVLRAQARLQLGDPAAAYLDYTAALSAPGLPDDERAPLLVNRGAAREMMGDRAGAIVDFDAVLALPGAPQDQRLKALLNRADVHRRAGKLEQAIAEATALAGSPESGGSPERGRAWLVVALSLLAQGDLPSASAAVRRHLDERVDPAPSGAAEALSRCRSPEELEELVERLI